MLSKTNTASSPGAFSENVPAASVTVPVAVPSTDTVAPGNGTPAASFTEPATDTGPWAQAPRLPVRRAAAVISNFFVRFILVFVVFSVVICKFGNFSLTLAPARTSERDSISVWERGYK